MPEVCDCADVCKITAGQPQPIASCRGLERQAPSPELMARATQAVLGIIGVDDRANTGQAVVSPATHKMAADIARAVIEVIPDHSMPLAAPVPGAGGKGDPDDWP